jgi:hypothetical protein
MLGRTVEERKKAQELLQVRAAMMIYYSKNLLFLSTRALSL